jgi:hypothetical protein
MTRSLATLDVFRRKISVADIAIVSVLSLAMFACAGEVPTKPAREFKFEVYRVVTECPTCGTRELTEAEYARLVTAIGQIDSTTQDCLDIKEYAWMEWFSVTSVGEDPYPGWHIGTGGNPPAQGDKTHLREDTIDGSNPNGLRKLIIHEIAHHVGFNEAMANFYMDLCATAQ